MNLAPFVKDNSGSSFEVHIFEDHVIKHPKKKKHQQDHVLERLVYLQNKLAEVMPEVLPCQRLELSIVMPRAPGLRGDKLSAKGWCAVKERLREIYDRAGRYGFKLEDMRKHNVFYDETTDSIYLVDGQMFKKAGD